MEKLLHDEKYAEMLNVIANTCLLYNNRTVLGRHIDYNLDKNNVSKMNAFRLRSSFHELASEVYTQYQGNCNLEEFLTLYRETSLFFSDNFRRSFALDLHDSQTEGFQRKIEQIYAMLDFAYSEGDKDVEWEKLSFLGKKRELCRDFYQENCLERKISIPIFLLLMLGLLPTYSSNKGAAKHMVDDFRLLVDFLRTYSNRKKGVFANAPILTRFETELKNEMGKIQKKGGDVDMAISRLQMVMKTDLFFTLFNGYSSHKNAGRLNRNLDVIEYDLDGIWIETEGGHTNFWMIEQLENGYFLHYYQKVMVGDGFAFKHTRYECRMVLDCETPMVFVAHPSYFRMLTNREDSEIMKMWACADFGYESTACYPNADGEITVIKLMPTINVDGWFPLRSLYRVANDKPYLQCLADYKVLEMFPDDTYLLTKSLCAITTNAIYLEVENFVGRELDAKGKYLRVPKELDDSLQDISLDDFVGVCVFENGDAFFTVPHSLLYCKINTEAERKTHGVELCDTIVP